MKYLSSIFSFDTLRLADARYPKGALLAFSLTLAVEVGLHFARPLLPTPALWSTASPKVAQVLARSRYTERPLDVLIIGPSHAEIDIWPKAMAEQVPEYGYSTYNGGMNGRTYSVLEFIYSHVYRDAFRPKCVILTMSPLMVNEYNQWMERNTAEFFAAPGPKCVISRGLYRAWQRFLVEHVYLYRYRKRLERGARDPVASCYGLDEDGYRAIKGIYTDEDRIRLQRLDHPYQQAMREFKFGGPSAEALVRLIKTLTEEGIVVVGINMPFRPEFLTISPTGVADYEEYLDEMEHLQSKYGFVWIDYQRSLLLEDTEFSDVDHLNVDGARTLSERLARDLVEILGQMEDGRCCEGQRPNQR